MICKKKFLKCPLKVKRKIHKFNMNDIVMVERYLSYLFEFRRVFKITYTYKQSDLNVLRE